MEMSSNTYPVMSERKGHARDRPVGIQCIPDREMQHCAGFDDFGEIIEPI